MNLLKLLWSFYGRIGRAAFLAGHVLIWALMAGVFAAVIYLPLPATPWVRDLIFYFVIIFFSWVQLALAAKRFHDLGEAGVFCVLLFIPFVNLIIFIRLLFKRGEGRDNQYGPSAGWLSVGARSRWAQQA
jgi:uncharacterized membrane protein YhaH (DUF805 family)